MIRTDIFCRALPWSRLLITQGQLPDELNLRLANRVSALVALVFVVALPGAFALPALGSLALLAAGVFTALNWPLLRFFTAQGGIIFGIGAALLHLLYYVYSSIAFAWVAISTAPARWLRSRT